MHNDISNQPLPKFPPRLKESHKGDFGHAFLVGGSSAMSGAIALAGMAALRSGAGKVTLVVPDSIQATVASFEPSYMTLGMPADVEGYFALAAEQSLFEALETATACAIGPGLGRSEETQTLVQKVHAEIICPMVVDADALFALSKLKDAWPPAAGPRIWTPHMGEFERLTGILPSSIKKERDGIQAAMELANSVPTKEEADFVLVLKGHRTIVTDGIHVSINTTGNPGMATGGTGDVLTGIITALLSQGLTCFAAARLGVYLHGCAGDIAASKEGQMSLIASDLLRYLTKSHPGIRCSLGLLMLAKAQRKH